MTELRLKGSTKLGGLERMIGEQNRHDMESSRKQREGTQGRKSQRIWREPAERDLIRLGCAAHIMIQRTRGWRQISEVEVSDDSLDETLRP